MLTFARFSFIALFGGSLLLWSACAGPEFNASGSTEGSTQTTSSGAAGGGQGGSGGLPPCMADQDCLPPQNPCQIASCNNGICGFQDAPMGTIPDDGNPCTHDKCIGSMESHPPEQGGIPCPTGVCNGLADNPTCVQCVNSSNCDLDPCFDSVECLNNVCVKMNPRPQGTACGDSDSDQCTDGGDCVDCVTNIGCLTDCGQICVCDVLQNKCMAP